MDLVWAFLLGAIVCEVSAAVALRYSVGFTRPIATAIALGTFGSAFFLVSLALRKIPVSVAYPIWAGAGTAGVALVGVTVLRERTSVRKALGVALIVAGIVLLHLNAGEG
jgi:small multidrug resistance pump